MQKRLRDEEWRLLRGEEVPRGFFLSGPRLDSPKNPMTGEVVTPRTKTKMTMETQPFEDFFPVENGDFPMSMLVFRGV